MTREELGGKPGGGGRRPLVQESETLARQSVFTSLSPRFLVRPVAASRVLRDEAMLATRGKEGFKRGRQEECPGPQRDGDGGQELGERQAQPQWGLVGGERCCGPGQESCGGWAAPLRKGAERDAETDQTILRWGGPGRMKPQARAYSDQLPTKACLWTPSLPLLL